MNSQYSVQAQMRFLTQLVLGGLLVFFLGTVIFLIAAMDNPFRAEVFVSRYPKS